MSYATSQDESPTFDARVPEHEVEAHEPSRRAPGFGWFFSDVVWLEPVDGDASSDDSR